MLKKFERLLSRKGQGMIEYALLLGFVAIITVALFTDDGLYNSFKNALGTVKSLFTTFNSAYGNS